MTVKFEEKGNQNNNYIEILKKGQVQSKITDGQLFSKVQYGHNWSHIGNLKIDLNEKAYNSHLMKTALKISLTFGIAMLFKSVRKDFQTVRSGIKEVKILKKSNESHFDNFIPPIMTKTSSEKNESIAKTTLTTPRDSATTKPKGGLQTYLAGNKKLHEFQKEPILNLYNLALASENPMHTLEREIKAGIPDLWGEPKAAFLYKDLGQMLTVANYTRSADFLSGHQKQTLRAAYTEHILQRSQNSFNDRIIARIGVDWDRDKADQIISDFSKFRVNPANFERESYKTKSTSNANIEFIEKEAETAGVIAFYKIGKTASFGNFAECPNKVTVDGNEFRCAEAAFQYAKCKLAGVPKTDLDKFFSADGEKAFRLSRSFIPKNSQREQVLMRKNWLTVRNKTMWNILHAKFEQNPTMKAELKASGDAFLLEHNESDQRDRYWSDNNDGEGQNMLGQMLMNYRDGKSMPSAPSEEDQDIIRDHAQKFGSNPHYTIW